MTRPPSLPFAFTPLVQPQTDVSPTRLPQGFDASIALLMGNLCKLTYQQFALGQTTLSGELLETLNGLGSFTQTAAFTFSESLVARGTIGAAGEYATIPIGFALTGTPNGGSDLNVIALRGTRSLSEWLYDADAVPTSWHVGDNNGHKFRVLPPFEYGVVHGGFYNVYTHGTDGARPVESRDVDWASYSRPAGSLAAQIEALLHASEFDPSLPLYITGHSLGAALAILCGMDVGVNFPTRFPSKPSQQLAVYTLAAPRVAAGVSLDNVSLLTVHTSAFTDPYSKAASNTFAIINAADIVPISPPSNLGVGALEVEFAQVASTSNRMVFCAQMGSIGGNHACTDTYVAYLEQLSRILV